MSRNGIKKTVSCLRNQWDGLEDVQIVCDSGDGSARRRESEWDGGRVRYGNRAGCVVV